VQVKAKPNKFALWVLSMVLPKQLMTLLYICMVHYVDLAWLKVLERFSLLSVNKIHPHVYGWPGVSPP